MHLDDALYIGLMSGTSLDGVDGVLLRLPEQATGELEILASTHLPFDAALHTAALQLQQPGPNEIEREAELANAIARIYADCTAALLQQHTAQNVRAIGAHGQTIRHRPEAGFTRQSLNAALLAELSGIDVVADFRSRDVAAGGQGAPLVPAFHRALFGAPGVCRVVANIGGIANVSVLAADGSTSGYDTGPGNVLMDYWIAQQRGEPYDAGGAWAAQGQVCAGLLARMLSEPYLQLAAPKSTGRDLFHGVWLQQHLLHWPEVVAVDVQATLCALTAHSLAAAISKEVSAVYVCGGGAYNACLMTMLAQAIQQQGGRASLHSTAALDMDPEQVEACAFAWLAQQFFRREPGNLPAVTGARGGRVLGALYPR